MLQLSACIKRARVAEKYLTPSPILLRVRNGTSTNEFLDNWYYSIFTNTCECGNADTNEPAKAET